MLTFQFVIDLRMLYSTLITVNVFTINEYRFFFFSAFYSFTMVNLFLFLLYFIFCIHLELRYVNWNSSILKK